MNLFLSTGRGGLVFHNRNDMFGRLSHYLLFTLHEALLMFDRGVIW